MNYKRHNQGNRAHFFYMLPTYEQIKPYIDLGFISEQSHPDAPWLRIFNYTQSCQFAQEWNDVTRQCRGLILNIDTGEVIARPFPKFFNYGEHVSKGWAIPTSKPVVYEKLDGSLGILYQLNGKPWIATRGSFMSEQAQWATQWYRENIGHDAPIGTTVLFEIIYPQNRIVVNYDFSGLVFLAGLSIANGSDQLHFRAMYSRNAKVIPYTDMESLEKLDTPNSEGFVLFYPEENVRMKIKFPEYVRLHKLVTGLSEIAIWEHLRDGKSLEDLVEKVPDEFYKWVSAVVQKLKEQYMEIWAEADTITAEAMLRSMERKERALYIQANTKYPGICFAMLDNKPIEPLIWRLVRPHGKSSFKVDIDL